MTAASAFRAISHARRSCKRFSKDKAIPDSVLEDILRSTIRSPSSFNLQPTQIILVRDSTRKEKLADTAMIGPGNIYRTRDCSTLAVFLSDLQASKRIARIQQLEAHTTPADYRATMALRTHFLLGQDVVATALKQAALSVASRTLKPMPAVDSIATWSAKNTALWVQSYVLAATSHGLATTIMEGFDPRLVKEVLRVPDRYAVPMVVATGYGYQNDEGEAAHSARLGLEELVFDGVFGEPMVFEDTDEEGDAVEGL